MVGDAQPYYPTPVSQKGFRSPLQWQLAKILKKNQLRDLVAVMAALNGVAAGATATSQYKRVLAATSPSETPPLVTQIGELGGARAIETVSAINRATTAADITFINDMLNNALLSAGITYPTVVGSGGGGKLVNGTVTF
jgi:hypothetical protein